MRAFAHPVKSGDRVLTARRSNQQRRRRLRARLLDALAHHSRLLGDMQRIGQLNLSCAQCHDSLPGKRLAGSLIPEAHPTGYPVYRLEWQAMGSLQRRMRGCMSGVRAEPFAYGAQELVELELYLKTRAKGMAPSAKLRPEPMPQNSLNSKTSR